MVSRVWPEVLLNKCAQLSPHAAGGIRLCVMCWILSNTHRLGNRATSLEGRSEKVSLQCIYINVYVTEPITREKISKGPRERERGDFYSNRGKWAESIERITPPFSRAWASRLNTLSTLGSRWKDVPPSRRVSRIIRLSSSRCRNEWQGGASVPNGLPLTCEWMRTPEPTGFPPTTRGFLFSFFPTGQVEAFT